MLIQACDGGFARACYEISWRFREGNKVRHDLALSLSYFLDTCEIEGDIRFCGREFKREFPSAKEIDWRDTAEEFRRVCDEKSPNGCFRLGFMYTMGLDASKGFEQGKDLFLLAYNLGSKRSCYALGASIAEGRNDNILATELFREVCEQGYARGCTRVG